SARNDSSAPPAVTGPSFSLPQISAVLPADRSLRPPLGRIQTSSYRIPRASPPPSALPGPPALRTPGSVLPPTAAPTRIPRRLPFPPPLFPDSLAFPPSSPPTARCPTRRSLPSAPR